MSEIRRTYSLSVLPYRTSNIRSSVYYPSIRRVHSLPALYNSGIRYVSADYYYPSTYRYYRDLDSIDYYWYYGRYRCGSYNEWPYRPYLYSYYPFVSYYSGYRPLRSWYLDYDYYWPRYRYLSSYYYDHYLDSYWRRRLDPDWYRPVWWYSRYWGYNYY